MDAGNDLYRILKKHFCSNKWRWRNATILQSLDAPFSQTLNRLPTLSVPSLRPVPVKSPRQQWLGRDDEEPGRCIDSPGQQRDGYRTLDEKMQFV